MTSSFRYTAALVAVCFVPLSHAATVANEPIIVTASRSAETADETLASVSVITRKDIERLQAQSVPELLRSIPGVSISNSGGLGKLTSVFLRGGNSSHVLVLVDGIKIGSTTSGTTAFEQLPVEEIERIEIVRGPRSSLYGSEAIGGVIQIFTRKGGGALTPRASIGGGSNSTYKATAGLSGGGDRNWFNLSVSGLDTKGINACDGILDVAGCFTNEPDKDGYRNTSGSARVGHRFDNGTQLEAFWLRALGTTAFDQADDYDSVNYRSIENGPNTADFLQESLGASVKLPVTSIWQLTLLAGHSRDETDNFKSGGIFDSRFNTDRDSVSLQNDISVGDDQMITVGLDYQDDRVDSDTPFNETSRNDKGLFVQYRGGYGAHDLQLALRSDDNEQFGNHGTGSAAWGYAINDKLRLTASFGTAFKAPTFNDLYYPYGYGNPDLDPEQSRSFELGMNGTVQPLGWSINAYHTRVDELIGLDANYVPININKARLLGLETVLTTTLAGWDIHTSATLLDPKNRSDGVNNGNILPRRARQMFDFALDRDVGRYRLGTTLHAEGRRYDDLANNVSMGGYATVDLRAEYPLTPDWRLQGSVTNVLDKDYETANLFNQPGLGFFVTLRYQPTPTADRTTP